MLKSGFVQFNKLCPQLLQICVVPLKLVELLRSLPATVVLSSLFSTTAPCATATNFSSASAHCGNAAVCCFDIVQVAVAVATVPWVPCTLYLQVSYDKLVDDVVPRRLLEDREVSKIVLQPPCLGLG